MGPLRRFSDFPSEPGKFQPSFIASFEGCAAIKNSIPGGNPPEPMHKHWFDLYYFVIEGSLGVQAGTKSFLLPRYTLVRLPADTPHMAYNDEDGEVLQLELVMPAYVPMKAGVLMPLMDLCEAEDGLELPEECIRSIEPGGWVPASGADGLEFQTLSGRALGSADGNVSALRRAGGQAPPSYGVRDHDYMCFVLEGSLCAEVSGRRLSVGPNELLAVPQGAPHRIWNEDPSPTLELAVMTPEPEGEDPSSWQREVAFALA